MKRLALFAAALVATTGGAAAQSYRASMVYPNPDGDMNAIRSRGPCTDPWVTVALEIVTGRADPAYCAPALYVGGRWSSFNDLVHGVSAALGALRADGRLQVLPVRGANYAMIGVFRNDPATGIAALVAAGGGNLVAAGGGNLVAAGGGNLVAAGGGNAVSISGNALVAAGGGNLAPVATVRGAYGLQSVGSSRKLRLANGSGIGF